MRADRWERVAELYRAALEQDESQRSAWLESACVGDEEVRREVESLLAHEGRAQSFMEEARDGSRCESAGWGGGFAPR